MSASNLLLCVVSELYFALGIPAAFAQQVQVPVSVQTDDWRLNGQKLGKTVSPAAFITGIAGATGLTLYCGPKLRWRSYQCDADKACTIPVCGEGAGSRMRPMPGIEAQEAGISFLPQWFDRFLQREERSPKTLAARASGEPTEAVVAMTPDGVDFSPALRKVVEGKRCLLLYSLAADGAPITVELDWNAEKPAAGVQRLPVRAGAYRLASPLEGGCKPNPNAEGAWIVVAPLDRFEALSQSWQRAEQWMRGLDDDQVTTEMMVFLRHAFISGLADTLEAP